MERKLLEKYLKQVGLEVPHLKSKFQSGVYSARKIWVVGWVGGWVDGSFRKYYHFVAPSCKLELARFSA